METLTQPLIRGLVLKVASHCNLNCSYCYVYNQGDETYRQQPRFMSRETVDLLLKRVADYCRRHRLKSFRFIFHGGEPLLAPVSFYEQFVQNATRTLPAYTQVSYSLQTNGVLLSDNWCQVLGSLNVRIGISIDGPAAVHDAYRVDHRGRGSYKATIAGLRRAQEHPAFLYHPGVLVVVDPRVDSDDFLAHFVALNIRSLNLLLPDGAYHKLPPLLSLSDCQTPYADWLIALFDRWFELPSQARIQIRFFQQIINHILGLGGSAHALGRMDALFLVIETDGSIEAEDSLKICRSGITKEGMHLQTHSLQEALKAPLIAQCATTHHRLPTACQRCPIRDVCGGGFMVHRYHPANGFDNPSVYCRDLLKLITHIQNQLIKLLPAPLLAEAGVRALSFEQALLFLNDATNER